MGLVSSTKGRVMEGKRWRDDEREMYRGLDREVSRETEVKI